MDEQNTVVTEPTTESTVAPTQEPATTEPKKDDKPTSAEIEKLKIALSKANGEAAEYKRQLREKQTQAERAEAERQEQEKAMREELDALRRDKAVTDYTNKALEVGFDADTAAKAANAMASGDTAAMFDALKAFVEATKTRMENEALNRQPALSAGAPPSTNTVDAETAQIRQWMMGTN